ncbi:MAG: Unknown protein [uncultured Sulfurovum sp.]|uniref:DUF4384 domain-containing protein n=1 Tax=uncultured Sulfurovum sp. TaxID=269237 RepID=A0A6S6TS77_9BACT|nr:MAG: Unknown protein [uncultured Sulfurovum sp.]
MKIILKKYLLIPILFLVGELSFGLVSQHIMKSEPYLAVQKSVDDFMFDNRLSSFKSSKTSYTANESISFNIELNKKSHLYLLTLKDNQACLVFPSYQEKNIFEKGEVTLSSESLKVSQTQTAVQEFYVLSSEKPLTLSSFKETSCINRNEGLRVIQELEENGAEVLSLEVRVD